MTRQEAILQDVPSMRVERLKLKVAIGLANYQDAPIMQRRIDKIEERFNEVGFNRSGYERKPIPALSVEE